MRFLIKTAFWLSLVLLLLPFGLGGSDTEDQTIGPLQALVAAREAVADLSRICERKPDVCEAGRAAFHTIGVRARETARIALEMLEQTAGEPSDGEEDETRPRPLPVEETATEINLDESIKTGALDSGVDRQAP